MQERLQLGESHSRLRRGEVACRVFLGPLEPAASQLRVEADTQAVPAGVLAGWHTW